jgi:hypothetical protein
MQVPVPPVPGRLRLRFTQLKQQNEQLARLACAMYATDGVVAVETSPLTGSLLIQYDALRGKTTAFWDRIEAVLVAHNLLLDPRPLDRRDSGAPILAPKPVCAANGGARLHQASPAAAAPPRKPVTGATFGALERLIQRSAVALVAALL